jgi:hypothetical protein
LSSCSWAYVRLNERASSPDGAKNITPVASSG